MSEELVTISTATNPFGESSWANEPTQNPPAVNNNNGDNAPPPPTVENNIPPTNIDENKNPNEGEYDIFDENDFIKQEFGWDSKEVAKAELEQLRKLKETNQQSEIQFANDYSKQLFEYLKEGKEDDVYSFLDTKNKLKKVPDMNAVDALKLQLQLKNKHYSDADINDIIEDRYTLPEKPLQDDNEDDDVYEKRVSKWQSSVDKMNRRIERDALEAKQELAKMNQELVLPDIKKENEKAVDPAQQEEFERQKEAARLGFYSKLDNDYKNFSGYDLKYKDEEVEIPVSFNFSEEEKVSLKEELKNFQVEDFLSERWFPNGEPNVNQMMQDITLLKNGKNVMQKMVNEVGAKMKEHYIKIKSNISVNGNSNPPKPTGTENNLSTQIDFLWSQKY